MGKVSYLGFRPTDKDIKMLQELKNHFKNPVTEISNADVLRLALRQLYDKHINDGGNIR